MLARSNLMDEDLLAALPGFRQAEEPHKLIVETGQEELALRRALDECGGDRVRAAALLGVSRSTLLAQDENSTAFFQSDPLRPKKEAASKLSSEAPSKILAQSSFAAPHVSGS
jgi:hypothetical protein